MNIPYEKDNKERIPFTHYLEEFQALDPETASLRSGIPYDKNKKEFALRMLGKGISHFLAGICSPPG